MAFRTFRLANWTFYGCGTIAYGDFILHAGSPERSILCALARNAPHPITTRALADRQMFANDKSVSVMISQLRRAIRDLGAPNPIQSLRGFDGSFAYYWDEGTGQAGYLPPRFSATRGAAAGA